jgi:dGTPase
MSTHNPELSDIRCYLEEREAAWLDPRAAKSRHSRGRAKTENPDPYRTEFQRDRDRILHTKAFRRLKHKTQVFVSPEHDHYRTRLTHTLEVSQIARTVARALRLNEDLTEAIGIGHDLGHAPFGHVGEEALDEAYRRFDSQARFRHFEQSLRIVDVLEKRGQGLNLTWEVRDGILHHSKGKSDLMAAGKNLPSTLEGQVVRICDRVAYVNHDIDDAIRAGLLSTDDLPDECLRVLGRGHAQRITTMVNAIIEASSELQNGERRAKEQITMREDITHATDCLKDWMFSNIYKLEGVDETRRVKNVIISLFECFMNDPQKMRGPGGLPYLDVVSTHNEEISGAQLSQSELARHVCDFIAGMTDRFASQTYAQMFMPSSWRGV